jgi:hypothetical protein
MGDERGGRVPERAGSVTRDVADPLSRGSATRRPLKASASRPLTHVKPLRPNGA